MIVIIIPAKGGSNRLPNKNMTPLAGRPMIDHTIAFARAATCADRIVVTTDSDEIDQHARAQGLPVIRRPTSLGGEVPILDVYRHAIANLADGDKVKVVIGLQVDHPDRDVTIDAAFEQFSAAGADRLMSKQADGVKNGAHYILTRHFVDSGESRKDLTIVDDCTNIHFSDDLKRAEERLRRRSS